MSTPSNTMAKTPLNILPHVKTNNKLE